jgi:hypothetical protein
MNPRVKPVLLEVKALLHLDRFRRFGLPFALLLVIALLCYTNIKQAQTITAQEDLIHTLFADSLELSAKRMQQGKARAADFKKPDVMPASPVGATQHKPVADQ